MLRLKSEGACGFCKRTVASNAVAKHLQICKERTKANLEKGGSEQIFLIKASAGPFFVYFEAEGSATLKNVDSFLRDIWLECCGHLSTFEIEGVTYAYEPQPEYNDKSMNIKLDAVLRPVLSFGYEYDFGTTTALAMKCISIRIGKLKGIQTLARNNLQEFACSKCGKPAKEICSQCVYEGEALLCRPCAKKHECGEEMLLPVVNSPRMGMCGYTG